MSANPKTDICRKNSPKEPRNFKHSVQKQTIQMKVSSLFIPPKGGAGLAGKRRNRKPSSSERELETKRPDSLLVVFQNQMCHLKV